MSEKFPSSSPKETMSDDQKALYEAYAQEQTQKNETAAPFIAEQPDELQAMFDAPAIKDEERNVTLPADYKTFENKDVTPTPAARREAAVTRVSRVEGSLASGNAAETAPANPEKAARTVQKAGSEALSTDVAKRLLEQNQALVRQLEDVTARLNKLMAEGAAATARNAERTSRVRTSKSEAVPPQPEIPGYQRSHETAMGILSQEAREAINRKKNAQARKAERKRVRGLEKDMRKAETKDRRSAWRMAAGRRLRAFGKAALGKLTGKGPGWTTKGANAGASRDINPKL